MHRVANYAMWHTEQNKNLGGWVTEIICEETGKISCRTYDECQKTSRVLAEKIVEFMNEIEEPNNNVNIANKE